MENGDSSQVGGTSGDEFLVPPSRRYFYDSDKDENRSSEGDHQAAYHIEYDDDKAKHLADVGVRAGDRNNDRVVTDKIIYEVRPMKG